MKSGKCYYFSSISVLFSLIQLITASILFANARGAGISCIDEAINRTLEIRSLPEKRYLQTLDGQKILLEKLYEQCISKFPWCALFPKFYYWKSDIKTIISDTDHGKVQHKIRCYHNCISIFCPNRFDSLKTHGDVAEFYDSEGKFIGIAVYMGAGKYCTLPYNDSQDGN